MTALSKRLSALANLVASADVVADVGCDHGYLSVYLVRQGIARKAIAMDLRPAPLQRAAAHIAKEGMGEFVETRLGDGLDALEAAEADCIVIAGMGGDVMIHILSRGRDVLAQGPQLILQPQSQIAKVRRILCEIGYAIVCEDMVEEDGKFYPMMKAQRLCGGQMTPQEEAFGPKLLESGDKTLRRFLIQKRRTTEALIGQLRQKAQTSPGAGCRLAELEEELGLICGALHTYWEEV